MAEYTKTGQEAVGDFINACLEDNSVAELERALEYGPDRGDMNMWNLTESEWTEAITTALSLLKERKAALG